MAHRPGDRFGRYELVSRLGHGGMAETWKARLLGAAGVTKSVVIKKILPAYADDEAFVSMFITEARITATLSHGNIAQVHDFGKADGEYFLAMELVDGKPLDHLMRRARKAGLPALPAQVSAFIALEMCQGLHYAHTRTDEHGKPLGLVHRDISPENVIISYEGQVKLVDFGIAKARARALRALPTAPGLVKGKYLFFSPEQAHGDEVDARTDVWATGVVLYEMLCGRLPVEGPEQTAVPKLINGLFPRPSDLRRDLPARLEGILMHALALDLKDRFQSSNAFGEALAGFLYSSKPRFSATSLSYLVQELFREELLQEGRKVRVPGSFLDELAQWKRSFTRALGDEAITTKPAGHKALRQAAIATRVVSLKGTDPDAVTTDPISDADREFPSTGETLPLSAERTTEPNDSATYEPSRRGSRVVLALIPLLLIAAAAAIALITLGTGWDLPAKLSAVFTAPPPPEPVKPPAPVRPPAPVSVTPPKKEPEPPPPAPETQPEPEPTEVSLTNGNAARLLAADAQRLIDQSEYAEAALALSRCLQIDPTNSECRLLKAKLLLQLENDEAASQSNLPRKRTDTPSKQLEDEPE